MILAHLVQEKNDLAAQDPEDLLEFDPELAHYLLALAHVGLRLLAGQALPGAADRESVVIQETPDLANDQHVLALVIAAIATPFHRLELRELLFPVPEYVRLYRAEIADFTDREIAFSRYGRKLVVIPRFQHRLPLGPLVFVLAGRSPRDVR